MPKTDPLSTKPVRAEREERVGRFRRVPIRFLLPNIITLLAVCSGVTAIRLGFEGRFELAVGAVILACLLDAIDGRVARLLKGASKFGAELDSLADFVNFGVVPAVLIYLWSLQSLNNLGWVVALGLAICCALRLARFNVAIDDPDKPAWMINFFTGVPAPAGAFLAMMPMYLGFLGIIPSGPAAAPFILPWVALVAFAMVSKLPTFSGKALGKRVDRDFALPIVGASVLFTVLLFSYPWQMLAGLAAIYVGLMPFGLRSYGKQKSAWEERRAKPVPAEETDGAL